MIHLDSRSSLIIVFGVTAFSVPFCGCASPGGMYGHIGIHSAPGKRERSSNSELAQHAKSEFWEAFHSARYDHLPVVIERLTAAYLENPNDSEVTLLLAHAHFWRLSERARSKVSENDPRITEHMVLANHYFAESQRLRPDDARIQGWQGSLRMALGSINNDARETRAGYFVLQDAWKAWPEFNGFTFAYALSAQPADTDVYQEAVRAAWSVVDGCANKRVDRKNPSVASSSAVARNRKDAPCHNSEKAPHNQEGFWLIAGDILLKADQRDTARQFYQNAYNAADFAAWPYRQEIENRLENPDSFIKGWMPSNEGSERPMLVNSSISCVVCHAKS